MRVAFLLERPSQFDAPLFSHAARDPEHAFEAWFTAVDPGGLAPDPELGRDVDWGFDRLAGYRWRPVPTRTELAALAAAPDTRPDLVMVNGWTRRSYLSTARTARRLGLRTALRIDRVLFPDEPAPGAFRRLLVGGLLARRFDRFLTTGSLGHAFLVAAGVPAARIGRFPYAVDHEAFTRAASASAAARESRRAGWGARAEDRVVLALAKFSAREAPWDLLDAAAAREAVPIRWILAGDGPERTRFAAEVARRGLDRVVLPGYVPYPELPSVYAAADLFVHPAREERWGVSIAEALACGLPVVASSRVGAAYDLVEPGGNGERYPVGDGRELAAAIERALALRPERVRACSTPRLSDFGLVSTWAGILAAARRSAEVDPA
jgi:glycosyltransferase involved in cell wall biosynthesis